MKAVRIIWSILLSLGLIAGSLSCCAEVEQAEMVKETIKYGASDIQTRTIDSPHYDVTAPSEGGMTIRNKVYSANDLESDQKGLYWEWDASLQQLTLKDWSVKNSGWDMDPAGTPYIVIDRLATVNIVGNNDRAFIYSSKGLVITGEGKLSRGIFNNNGSGDLFFNYATGIAASITNKTGNIAFNNSMTLDGDTTIWAENGDVEIYSSNIIANYIDAGNNLNIFDSVIFTSDHADYNDLYAANVLAARNSVLIYNFMKGDGGEDIDSSVALFTYNLAVKIKGKTYYYLDQYSLITQRKINNSFTLPNLSYHGVEGYAIPKSIKLTVASGYFVDFNDKLKIDGKVYGDVRYRDGSDPSQFYIVCPLTVRPGEEIPVTVRVQPSNAHLTLHWSTSHPNLVSIDRNGVLTLLPEAKNHIGEVVTVSAASTSYIFETKKDVFFISNAENDNQFQLPGGLKVIEDGAFAGIDASQIIIPEGVLEIGSAIFDECDDLKIIRMPDSAIEALSEDTFNGCDYVAFLCTSSGGAAAVYAKEHNIPYILY